MMRRAAFLALALSGSGLAPVVSAATAPEIKADSRALVVSSTQGASVEVSLDAVPEGVAFLAETSFGSLSIVEESKPGHYVARMSVPRHRAGSATSTAR